MKKKKERNVDTIQQDDILFQTLEKSKKKKKRKVIITILSVILILAITAVAGVNILRKKVRNNFAASSDQVLAYEVGTGSISTVVSGSGTLEDMDLTSITVPKGVQITEVLIHAKDKIQKGEILATVDMASVISVMADLQTELEELDRQISDAEDESAEELISSGVSGRVKVIYGEEGDNVVDVMYENGALAILSLDGYMAVDIETDILKTGDTVLVKISEEETIDGIVETVSSGTATILVTDDGPNYQQEVTVCNEEGIEIGKGNLSIHTPLRITGYAGTIDEIHVEHNQKVSDTSTLFTLEDTSYNANYHSLLRTRSEKEETLLELLNIRQNGALLSPMNGGVYGVDYTEDSTEETQEEGEETAIATLSADEKMSITLNVDETDILALELGQKVTVSINSISEDSFEGILTEINRTSSSSGTYSAIVELEKAEGMLSGMTASVSVQIEGVEDAVFIPLEALHLTSEGAYVYTSYNEELQEYGGKVDVITGLENSSYVEIKSGLNVGDCVYYTESTSNFGGGRMPNFDNGPMPNMDGGQMPDFGGQQMPDFGGEQRPDFGGQMPNFGGDFPSDK